MKRTLQFLLNTCTPTEQYHARPGTTYEIDDELAAEFVRNKIAVEVVQPKTAEQLAAEAAEAERKRLAAEAADAERKRLADEASNSQQPHTSPKRGRGRHASDTGSN